MSAAAPDERPRLSNLDSYLAWVKDERGVEAADYDELWSWSVADLDGFWTSIWDYFGVISRTVRGAALESRAMPGAEWFAGTELNYAEHVFADRARSTVAIVHGSETDRPAEVNWQTLRGDVAAAAAVLRELGVTRGDRVAAILPNVYETVVAFLATASLGAVWTCCSPDLGANTIVDRFEQVEPVVLIAVTSSVYGGRSFDRTEGLAAVVAALPTVRDVLVLPGLEDPAEEPLGTPRRLGWSDALARHADAQLFFEPVPFGHPLWILYSSGTTGKPKAIVHGHGGVLLEHLKSHHLHLDLQAGDRFLWFTSSGWMMWNFLVSGLLTDAAIVLFDGNPGHPGPERLWQFAEEAGVTFFGTSAAYLAAGRRQGVEPRRNGALGALRAVASTGSVLEPAAYDWARSVLGAEVSIQTCSGGTDVCTAFLGGVPGRETHGPELAARWLGCKVEAFDAQGRAVVGEVGELVVTAPMPSMPVAFWNDPHDERYRAAYFDLYPGVWRHGDWVELDRRGSAVIHGRSDATINRAGIRIGTSEIYRCLDTIPEIDSCLVVDLPRPGTDGWLILFVTVTEGSDLSGELEVRIRDAVRRQASPRHLPDEILEVPDIPRTANGKILEVPVKRILLGQDPADVVNREALADPSALDYFVELSGALSHHSVRG